MKLDRLADTFAAVSAGTGRGVRRTLDLPRALGAVLVGVAGGLLAHRGLTGRWLGRAAPPRRNQVDEASRESFPASDAPAFTGTTSGPPGPEGQTGEAEGEGEGRHARP